jgi:hypothetical protein
MKTILVVTQPFADYGKGDHITDADAIEAALDSNASHVVRAPHPGDEFYAEDAAEAADVEDEAAPPPPATSRRKAAGQTA